MRTPSDFHALALDLAAQLAHDGVGYAEVIVSLRRAAQARNRSAADPGRPGRGGRRGASRPGASSCAGCPTRSGSGASRRRDGPGRPRPRRPRPGVVGFGLGGDETAGPAADFAPLFAEVKAEGLGVTIHAGEVPAMGRGALDSVRAGRAGIAARTGSATGWPRRTTPACWRQLACSRDLRRAVPRQQRRSPGRCARLAAHPLRAFLEAGVPCCLNTDDRTLFGLDLRGRVRRGPARRWA